MLLGWEEVKIARIYYFPDKLNIKEKRNTERWG